MSLFEMILSSQKLTSNFSLSHCFPSNTSMCLFWPFLVFDCFSKKAKEEESFKGKCGI